MSEAGRSPSLFVALSHRNFRLIWFGLLASITGSMMQNAGLLWHVSLLVSPGKKALALGMVGLVRVVPIVVLSMLSGVVADAWNRRTLMLLTQTGAALVSLVLAVLTFRGLTTVWPIYVLAALGAAVGVFDLPARQALVPTLVPRKDLPNAISLNAMMFQVASVVGPSIGGVLIAAAGVGWVYVVNALSFGCVIVALLHDARRERPVRAGGGCAGRRGVAAGRHGRAPVRLHVAPHPLDDAARFLRDVLLVGHGAAADLRAGHPARGRAPATAGSTRRRPWGPC